MPWKWTGSLRRWCQGRRMLPRRRASPARTIGTSWTRMNSGRRPGSGIQDLPKSHLVALTGLPLSVEVAQEVAHKWYTLRKEDRVQLGWGGRAGAGGHLPRKTFKMPAQIPDSNFDGKRPPRHGHVCHACARRQEGAFLPGGAGPLPDQALRERDGILRCFPKTVLTKFRRS